MDSPSTPSGRSGQAPDPPTRQRAEARGAGEGAPANPFEDPRFLRAVRRAPPFMASFLLHLGLVALVLIPIVFSTRPAVPEPHGVQVIVADMSRGDDAPLAEQPGEGPLEAPQPVPEAPPPTQRVDQDAVSRRQVR